jgi:hypothetical protein
VLVRTPPAPARRAPLGPGPPGSGGESGLGAAGMGGGGRCRRRRAGRPPWRRPAGRRRSETGREMDALVQGAEGAGGSAVPRGVLEGAPRGVLEGACWGPTRMAGTSIMLHHGTIIQSYDCTCQSCKDDSVARWRERAGVLSCKGDWHVWRRLWRAGVSPDAWSGGAGSRSASRVARQRAAAACWRWCRGALRA